MEAGVGIFGTKAGMTQIFTAEGLAVPATVIALEDGNIVTQVKTAERDGYNAVQVGYREVKEQKVTKPELGHLRKAGAPPLKHLREFKVKEVAGYEPGQQLVVEELFKVGDLVDVAGTSIGKGFQEQGWVGELGAHWRLERALEKKFVVCEVVEWWTGICTQGGIKRWGFARGNMTHGSKSKREHGSIGMNSTPSRVFPGLKMPGQMGNVRTKLRKLEVLLVDPEKRAIVVKGSVPGKPGNVIEIAPAKCGGTAI
ncbi:hypothetical protein N2152v2_004055 [Parachlorella kessleri]